MDRDRSGTVSLREMRLHVRADEETRLAMGIEGTDMLKGSKWNKQLAAFFEATDADDSGEVDLEEFCSLFSLAPPVDRSGPKPPICTLTLTLTLIG